MLTSMLPVISRRLCSAAPRPGSLRPWAAARQQQQRGFKSTARACVKLTFIEANGTEVVCEAEEGDTLLDVALDNDLEVEGACGGECACSTCHMILEQSLFDDLGEVDEEEEDMLDLALALTDTSRLGCQIEITAAMEGARITLPEESESML